MRVKINNYGDIQYDETVLQHELQRDQ